MRMLPNRREGSQRDSTWRSFAPLWGAERDPPPPRGLEHLRGTPKVFEQRRSARARERVKDTPTGRITQARSQGKVRCDHGRGSTGVKGQRRGRGKGQGRGRSPRPRFSTIEGASWDGHSNESHCSSGRF